MKKVFWVVLFSAVTHSLLSQEVFNKSSNDRNYLLELARNVHDTDYINRRSKGLMVGDKMPDMLLSDLGKVINYPGAEKRISDFKGKLIVFDFWNTWCKSCIEDFPKMEKLQNELGEKIQIFLVNDVQTEEDVAAQTGIKFKTPELPIIFNHPNRKENEFSLLVQSSFFPATSTGQQVWIGPDGIVGLRGSSRNNYSQKMLDVLAGKEVFMSKLNGTAVLANNKLVSYHDVVYNFKNNPVRSGSLITRFNINYDPETNPFRENVIDTNLRTRRSTYINQNILALYLFAYKPLLTKLSKNLLWGPSKDSYMFFVRTKVGLNFFILPNGIDTSKYVNGLSNTRTQFPDIEINSSICYEQIAPLETSDEEFLENMQYDLNRYIRNVYGAEVKKEKRRVKCYLLTRTSNMDKVSVTKNSEYKDAGDTKKLKVVQDFSKLVTESKFIHYFFEQEHAKGNSLFFLNETGWEMNKKIDIPIPPIESYKSMNELREALKKYDLDIKEEYRELEFLVLKEIGK